MFLSVTVCTEIIYLHDINLRWGWAFFYSETVVGSRTALDVDNAAIFGRNDQGVTAGRHGGRVFWRLFGRRLKHSPEVFVAGRLFRNVAGRVCL